MLAPVIPTSFPTEYLPTAAALTLTASGAIFTTPTPMLPVQIQGTMSGKAETPLSTYLPTLSGEQASVEILEQVTDSPDITKESHQNNLPTAASSDLEVVSAETNALTIESTSSPSLNPTFGLATPTPAPPIPDATIQFLLLGDLSKVASPIPISVRLTCGQGKTIRFELYGEDGRVLTRYMRTYEQVPWSAARIDFNMDFEIKSAAELGRLVVSAEDPFGRLIEASSMDLVLISQGKNEINPPTGLQQRIIIQDPPEKSLIQTGKLIVSGRAKPASNQPLRAMLVGENGKILGQRLAGIVIPVPGDYGIFVAEVPYSVKELTPALLMVFEEGGIKSPYTYLTSIQVILAP